MRNRNLGIRLSLTVLLALTTACGPSDAEIQSMIDSAVQSALDESQAITTTVPPAATTSTAQPEQSEYQEAFLYGYRNGYFTGFGGDLPERLDDRDPNETGDRGYIDGYNTGYSDGQTGYFTDYPFGSAKAARLADNQLFNRILESGDLGLAEPDWEEGRSRGEELGAYYRQEELTPIPILDLITGTMDPVGAIYVDYSAVSTYSVAHLLGYAEGLSGFHLEDAAAPEDENERGRQMGFAHGVVTALSGFDREQGLRNVGLDTSLAGDPSSLEAGFVTGYELGLAVP